MSLTVPIYGFGGGGGGSELNFDVKDFRTEAELLASAGKENRIGVVTPVPMTGWRFDANQPEDLQEGEAWFSIGTSSEVEFNALKKNGIQVYPLSAKQYIGGAWVNVTAMSYQSGEWVDWFTYLYNKGDEYPDLTGGWSANNVTASTGVSVNALTITKNTDNIVLQQTASQKSACFSTEKPINVTEYKKAYFEVSFKRNDGSAWCMFCVHPNRSAPRNSAETELYGSDYENQVFEVNIENLRGNHYMSFAIYSTCTVTVRKVWLE